MKIFKAFFFVIFLLSLILTLGYLLYFNIADCGIAPLSCGDFSDNQSYPTQKISTPEGPEDMAIDTSAGFARLIVSCSPRRGSKENGSFVQMKIGKKISNPMIMVPQDVRVYPHGIHIAIIDSSTWLYAISHEPTSDGQVDKILRFLIKGDSLIWDQENVLTDPLLKIPNDLHVLSDGSLYVTNYIKNSGLSETLLTSMGKKTGDIAYYDGTGNWSVAIDQLCYPNGIYIDEIANQLIVANGACQEISKYDIAAAGQINLNTKQSTKQHDVDIPMGDNLVIDQNGMLWTTNHPCGLKFLSHAGNPTKLSPSQVRKINSSDMTSEVVFQNNGELISAASTAVYYDNHLYISQVFDPFILEMEIRE
jgi:hypothetical protein